MSFKDGQISSQKVNLQYTLLSAGNGGYAIRQPSERRIVSGDSRRGKAPCTLGGGTRGFPLGYNSEAI